MSGYDPKPTLGANGPIVLTHLPSTEIATPPRPPPRRYTAKSRLSGASRWHDRAPRTRLPGRNASTAVRSMPRALEPWISVDDTERLNAIEEEIALQERRIGGVHQRVFRAVEERSHRALPLQRAF